MIRRLRWAALVGSLTSGATAFAAPTETTLSPPNGARFLVGQRVDLRVEGKGTGPFSATLTVDGKNVAFTSGKQSSNETDGITAAGYGGFNRRGYSFLDPGAHVVTATITDASGTSTVTSNVSVVDPWGGNRPARNVIIMLGDGMGAAHRTAARIVRYGVTNGDPNGYLAMDKFPSSGMITTHSLNSIITDSAPGMSGYVTGNHQNNNQEGVFPAHVTNPFYAPRVEYLAEYMHRTLGKTLGIVSTADVEDATIAANAAHTLLRGNGTGIVDQYLDESDVDGRGRFGTGLRVLMGGGRRWFMPADQTGSSRANANDYATLPDDLVARWNLPASAAGALDPSRDLIADFGKAGFQYVSDSTGLQGLRSTPDRLLGLFAFGNMNVALDKLAKRRGTPLPAGGSYVVDDYMAPNQPMLDEMTDVALKVLRKNKNGFLLTVEGAHIDKQSHLMDADRAIGEVIEFDRAVAVARKYAEDNRDTLVLVLADHECSGFSIIGALKDSLAKLGGLPSDAATLSPATVPARQNSVGTYDAAAFPSYQILADGFPATYDIEGKLLVGFGASGDRFEGWLTKPLPVIDSLLPDNLKASLAAKGYAKEPALRAESAFGFYLRGNVAGGQAVHTASDIPVSAYSSDGALHRSFVGVQTNTDVFFKLARALMGGYKSFASSCDE